MHVDLLCWFSWYIITLNILTRHFETEEKKDRHKQNSNLLYDVASQSEITPCNKINKPLRG